MASNNTAIALTTRRAVRPRCVVEELSILRSSFHTRHSLRTYPGTMLIGPCYCFSSSIEMHRGMQRPHVPDASHMHPALLPALFSRDTKKATRWSGSPRQLSTSLQRDLRLYGQASPLERRACFMGPRAPISSASLPPPNTTCRVYATRPCAAAPPTQEQAAPHAQRWARAPRTVTAACKRLQVLRAWYTVAVRTLTPSRSPGTGMTCVAMAVYPVASK